MKKAYSHVATLALAAFSFSSCSRADYATTSAATPLTEASVAQAPAVASPSPAAEQSATVVATQPLAVPATTPAPAIATAAPVASAHAAATTSAVAPATAEPAAADQPTAKAAKPTLMQRLALNKVAKQLTKMDARQQNTASVEHTAARGKSLTILLVGIIVLLLGIIINVGWLITAGAIVTAIGLILLLLKAL